MKKIIETERIVLREWEERDFEPMCAINQDPRVMEFFPRFIGPDQTKQFIEKVERHLDEKGYSLYAAEVEGRFIGFIGLLDVDFEAHFTPAVEIGWRLAHDAWGKGYATEGAHAVLKDGWNRLGLEEIVSFATEGNWRSRRVMERIGMVRNPQDDFDTPKLPQNHPLKHHVLYRAKNPSRQEKENDIN